MQNMYSPRSDNKSGILGVCWDKSRNKWAAKIKVGGRHINLGRYDDKHAAREAYLKAKKAMHIEQTNCKRNPKPEFCGAIQK